MVGDADGWSCADTRVIAASPLELVMDCGRRRPLYCLDPTNCPPGAGVGFREVFAVGVKLRQVGPIVFASVPHFL